MSPVIEVQHLRKRYGSVTAADDISFEVHPGEIFGLLGPNGAGKTTTLECLEGIRQPDRGDLAVLGVDPSRRPGKLRRLIGVQLQSGGLPDEMTLEAGSWKLEAILRAGINCVFCLAEHASPERSRGRGPGVVAGCAAGHG